MITSGLRSVRWRATVPYNRRRSPASGSSRSTIPGKWGVWGTPTPPTISPIRWLPAACPPALNDYNQNIFYRTGGQAPPADDGCAAARGVGLANDLGQWRDRRSRGGNGRQGISADSRGVGRASPLPVHPA